MIELLRPHYPITLLCRVLEYPRRSFYYVPVPTDDTVLRTAIEQIMIRWPFYGYRRVTAQLRREGWSINSKLVRRLLHELGLTCRVGRVRWHTTDSTHGRPRYPNLVREVVVTAPDQAWCADITYLRLGQSFIYLAVILDLYTRAVRGWHLSRSLGQELTLTALRHALAQRVPVIHHSDQGVQYASRTYVDTLTAAGVAISMADVGQPTQNAVAERFMRTLKEEHVDYTEYHDFTDAYRQLKQWLEVDYTQLRMHSALEYATPAEYEAAYWDQRTQSPATG